MKLLKESQMLKDKNYQKALELVAAKPTPAKLTVDDQADLIAELKLAKDAYEAQDKLVKDHYKSVYEPMCTEKAVLEIRMHELQIRIDQLTANNPAADAMVKLVMKALKARK